MAIALAASQDHIATVFDSADSLLLIEAGPLRRKRVETMPAGMTTIQMQQKLRALKVHVLLCGAIANITQISLEEAGIIVIPFLKGNLTEVEAAFFANRLNEAVFCLPGCRRGWMGRGLGACSGGSGIGGQGTAGNKQKPIKRGRS